MEHLSIAPDPTLTLTLTSRIEAAAQRLCDHPFHRARRDGSLPDVVADQFELQDEWHLLPGYGRALARCATGVREIEHAIFLSRMATVCLENAAADRGKHRGETGPEANPAISAYVDFLMLSADSSPYAGLGALLPSAWLQLLVSDAAVRDHVPGSRLVEEILSDHPGEFYRGVVAEFVQVTVEVGASGTEADRRDLLRRFDLAARHEWAVIDAAWRLQTWPAPLPALERGPRA